MAENRDRMRIGDQERDSAVGMLQEHHAAGRLDAVEFNERMEKVLVARTQADIDVLFVDLPEPKPLGSAPDVPSVPATSAYSNRVNIYEGADSLNPAQPDPWFAQWWMILVAVGITVATRGNVGFIIPMMAIWLWVIYPSIRSSRRSQAVSPEQGPELARNYAATLSQEQRRRISHELDQGRKIQAVKLLREYTGAGLRDAKFAIDAWQRQIGG